MKINKQKAKEKTDAWLIMGWNVFFIRKEKKNEKQKAKSIKNEWKNKRWKKLKNY